MSGIPYLYDSCRFTTSNVYLQVIQAFSDGLYASPAVYSARNFFQRSSKQQTTFFYHFSHHTKMGPYNQVIIIIVVSTRRRRTCSIKPFDNNNRLPFLKYQNSLLYFTLGI